MLYEVITLGDFDLENSQELKQIKALVGSMTPKEREDPELRITSYNVCYTKLLRCGDKVGFLQANVAFALARHDLADEVRAALRELICD